jgi:predicted O-methyltransferase YrrM/SAM-dependent methyltransferase
MGTPDERPAERFGGHYDEWTERRLAWILANHGDDVFRGRTVLDIGGGRGHVSHRLLDLGAEAVEVVEGRLENIREAQPREGLSFTHANLERGLASARDEYDIVINFGTIYHVLNWEPMLIESVARARELVFIETEVIDSESEATRYVVEDAGLYDQSLSGIGTRPSEFEIDRLLARIPNTEPRKVLDGALNAEFHRYDWENRLEGLVENGLRRFWSVVRAPGADPAAERASVDALLTEVHRHKAIDTLLLVRHNQHLLERRAAASDGDGELPARELLETLARLHPLQARLDVVPDDEPLEPLERRRRVPGHMLPRSCTDAEGLAIYRLITANGLRSGFEIGTGAGYATAYAGLALARTGGGLVTMDCYAEELTGRAGGGSDALQAAAAEVSARVETGDLPAGLALADEQLTALGLEDVVTVSIGVSPGSVADAIAGRTLDFVLIDGDRTGDAPARDFEAVRPGLAERCAVVLPEPAAAAAAAALEGATVHPFPSRSGFALVARGLDQTGVAALAGLFRRAEG